MVKVPPSIARCKCYRWLKERDSEFVPSIDRVAAIAEKQLAHQVPRIFPHYTKHDIEHSARVLEYMAALVNDLDSLCELDVALLVYSAILHDIGMALGDSGIRQLKNDELNECPIKFAAMLKLRDGNEAVAIQELVRRVHADISAHKVRTEFASCLMLPEIETVSIAEDVADICRSHTRDASWIAENIDDQNMKGRFTYSPRFVSHVLRLADLLDFDSRRTPLCLYHLLAPAGKSNEEWLQHFTISNTEKVRQDRTSGQKRIVLYGKCEDPGLHRKVLSYIGWIDAELTAAIEATENMPPQFRLVLRDRVEHRIRASGYSISDFRITVNFRSMSSLLMGEHIYGDRRFGLRELVQNGIDACRVRAEVEAKGRRLGDPGYEPRVQVILDEGEDRVIVRDNGCGMTESTIRNYFLNIGRSYYASEDYLLQDLGYQPIGRFGIGFLACFMLSNEVSVRTRHFTTGTRCDISFEKGSEFISFTRVEDNTFPGTEVALSFRHFMQSFEDKVENLVQFLGRHILTEDITVEVVDRQSETTHGVEQHLAFTDAAVKGQIDCNLTPYLVGVRCQARVRRTGTCVRSISHLDVDLEHLVIWDGEYLRKIDDAQLSDIVDGTQLKYFTLDVIDEYDEADFKTLRERFGDTEEILDKFDKVASITVLVPPDKQWLIDEHETDCDPDFVMVDDLTVATVLREVGVSGFVPRVSTVAVDFLRHPDTDTFLPYKTEWGKLSDVQWWAPGGATASVFVRGIRIGKAALPRLPLPVFCDLRTLVVDITHPDIVPNISRDSFDDDTQARLSYAIHHSMLSAWCGEIATDDFEKVLLRMFIDRFYGTDDALLRSRDAESQIE